MSSPSRPLAVIGARSAAGAYGPGQHNTPIVLRSHGLIDALATGQREVQDMGDTDVFEFCEDPSNPRTRNVEAVVAACRQVRQKVAAAMGQGCDVLVLGGDCTVELGTVAGAVSTLDGVGLVYVDLDADLNTPESADGVLDWMGLAHLLALEGCEPGLTAIGPRVPLLEPASVRLLGAKNLTDAERGHIRRVQLQVEDVETIKSALDAVIERTAEWAAGFEAVLVHVDFDVLDFDDFPIAENTRRSSGGLLLSELAELITRLCAIGNVRGLTITEINFDHAPATTEAAQAIIDILRTAVT